MVLFSLLVWYITVCSADPFQSGHLGWFPQELDVVNYARGSIFPKPQYQQPTRQLFTLDPNQFKFVNLGKNSDVLTIALNRYYNLTFPDQHKKYNKNYGLITDLIITVESEYKSQSINTNETCKSSSQTINNLYLSLAIILRLIDCL